MNRNLASLGLFGVFLGAFITPFGLFTLWSPDSAAPERILEVRQTDARQSKGESSSRADGLFGQSPASSAAPTNPGHQEAVDEQPAAEKRLARGVVVPRFRVPLRAAEDGIVKWVANGTVRARDATAIDAPSDVIVADVEQSADNLARPAAVLSTTQMDAEISRQEASIKAARHAVDEAEEELKLHRYQRGVTKTLADKKIVTRDEYIEQVYRTEMAAQRLAEARERLVVEQRQLTALERRRNNHSLFSPIDGTIVEVVSHPGQYVLKGEVVAWIESNERQLRVVISEQEVSERGLVLTQLKGFRREDGRRFALDVSREPLSYRPDRTVAIYFADVGNSLRGMVNGEVIEGTLF